MNNKEIIERASQKVGSLSELARQLGWDKGSIAAIKRGDLSLPAYRAAQLAQVLEMDEQVAYLQALASQAKTEDEKKYWLAQIRKARS